MDKSSTAVMERTAVGPLSQGELRAIDAYWRAANYVSVGQIYLYANPLRLEDINGIQEDARSHDRTTRPHWPMIVLRSPKGWTGPKEVDGKPVEGTWRSHQVPVTDFARKRDHIKLLEEWMKSYRPEEPFDENGALLPELRALAPEGNHRIRGNPHANGGLLLKQLRLPDFRGYAVEDRVPRLGYMSACVRRAVRDRLIDHKYYIAEHGADMPEILDWTWQRPAGAGRSEANA